MKKRFLFIIIPITIVLGSCEYNPNYVKELRGRWKFSIGDNKQWADPSFDDKNWDRIYVPSSWEEHGYRDYNGYAWYRKQVRIPKNTDKSNLYLYMGKIDDVDEVYFNGKLIGSCGSFPPNYKGEYQVQRRYLIPPDLINYKDENTIAVRVYDGKESGGIRGGKIGIYTSDMIPVDVSLEGNWKFHLNDSMLWKNENYNDSNWKTINVPEHWENQGYNTYDGYAWYRKEFDLPKELLHEKLIVLAGKIDDIDEVYINGNLVGSTGKFDADSNQMQTYGYWDEYRGYYPPDDVKFKETGNVIAVRVFDANGLGGIYEGPVGIVSQDKYTKYWQDKKKRYR